MKTENIISDFLTEFKDLPSVEKELAILFPSRTIKRVLFVLPPDVDGSAFNYEAAHRGRCYNYPPYGIGLLSRRLIDMGLKVHIVNLNNEILKAARQSDTKDAFCFDSTWKKSLFAAVDSFKPDLVGVSCMFTMTHRSTVLVCGELKNSYPYIPVCVGGVHITNCLVFKEAFRKMLNDLRAVDLFFLFEAENSFESFIKVVNRKEPAEKLSQLFFNGKRRKFYFPDKKIPKERELNIIPAYELMETKSLSDYGVIGSFFCLKEKGERFATILSNRGCRGRCTYCSVRNFNGPGIRMRSIQSIIDELRLLRENFGIGHVMWLDDDLFFDHKRTISLFEEIERRVPGITWDCTNGVIASSCTEELIDAAGRSGCIGLNLGVESGNPKILKIVKKPGTIRQFLDAARVLKKFEKINSRVFLMIGFPKETYRMILDTFNLALELDLDWYNITIFEPLPNTSIIKESVSVEADDTEAALKGHGLLSVLKRNRKVDFTNVRYNTGPFGKRQELLLKKGIFLQSANPFRGRNLDAVPAKKELDNIWFYLNFYLNFWRLFKIKSPVKLEQQYRYLKNITELIAPDDPFPMYFYAYLKNKLRHKTDTALTQRLRRCLESSEHWRQRFKHFNLSVSHLETGEYPDELQENLLHRQGSS